MVPQFTLVSTVFNESKRLSVTLSDLLAQTLLPDEIIITDAGSTDGTYEQLKQFAASSPMPVTILQKPRCNVAEGRNMAIRASKYDLILSTDFGCRFHPDWIRSLMSPFQNTSVQVVGGSYSVIEEELKNDAEKTGYILSNGYQFDPNSEHYIPSSRSIAYKKSVFEQIGGYCEWLTLAADDLIFGMQIRKLGIPIVIVGKPLVYWGRHKKMIGYGKETFRYGLGDGEARIKFFQFTKYLAFFISRIAFVLIVLAALILQNTNLLLINILMLPGFLPYYHHLRTWLRLRSSKYHFGIFLNGFRMLEMTHYFYIKGYIKGYFLSSRSTKNSAEALKKYLSGEYGAV